MSRSPLKKARNIATDSEKVPFSYMQDGEIIGYDMALLSLICEKLGYGLEKHGMNFGGVIPAIASGKYNLASAGIAETEERAAAVLFSEPIYYGDTIIAVLDENAGKNAGFIANMKDAFYNTFVKENRYELIVDGFKTTLFITIISVLLGTLLGFGFCMIRRGRSKILKAIVSIIGGFMQGLPTVVVLLIFAYIVFRKVPLSVEWVAIVVFTLSFAVHSGSVMFEGLSHIDKGQSEAGSALGFKKSGVFRHILFPQGFRRFIHAYFSAAIALMQETAVAGYIAVEDLTKASDIIRSLTFDAFFPLLVTAAVYLLLTLALIKTLNAVNKKLLPLSGAKPAAKKAMLKGIVAATK
jgi:polar amino acid transport system substrate-binding protein